MQVKKATVVSFLSLIMLSVWGGRSLGTPTFRTRFVHSDIPGALIWKTQRLRVKPPLLYGVSPDGYFDVQSGDKTVRVAAIYMDDAHQPMIPAGTVNWLRRAGLQQLMLETVTYETPLEYDSAPGKTAWTPRIKMSGIHLHSGPQGDRTFSLFHWFSLDGLSYDDDGLLVGTPDLLAGFSATKQTLALQAFGDVDAQDMYLQVEKAENEGKVPPMPPAGLQLGRRPPWKLALYPFSLRGKNNDEAPIVDITEALDLDNNDNTTWYGHRAPSQRIIHDVMPTRPINVKVSQVQEVSVADLLREVPE